MPEVYVMLHQTISQTFIQFLLLTLTHFLFFPREKPVEPNDITVDCTKNFPPIKEEIYTAKNQMTSP